MGSFTSDYQISITLTLTVSVKMLKSPVIEVVTRNGLNFVVKLNSPFWFGFYFLKEINRRENNALSNAVPKTIIKF